MHRLPVDNFVDKCRLYKYCIVDKSVDKSVDNYWFEGLTFANGLCIVTARSSPSPSYRIIHYRQDYSTASHEHHRWWWCRIDRLDTTLIMLNRGLNGAFSSAGGIISAGLCMWIVLIFHWLGRKGKIAGMSPSSTPDCQQCIFL